MVVATLHLGHFGFGRWGGRVTSVITYLASRSVLVLVLLDKQLRAAIMGRKRGPTTAGLYWPQLAQCWWWS
jgi:hypothetical protein|tara:strand:+ start:424 stop:636 length:213 start_codon:yes stop_codon:yes gene_type:complete